MQTTDTRKLLSVSLQASVLTYALNQADVLTSQMYLNILTWPILPWKLQFNTRNKKLKDRLSWACLHLYVEFHKGRRPAGRLGIFFLSPEDGTGDRARLEHRNNVYRKLSFPIASGIFWRSFVKRKTFKKHTLLFVKQPTGRLFI